jgi:hypothetical protein
MKQAGYTNITSTISIVTTIINILDKGEMKMVRDGEWKDLLEQLGQTARTKT